MKWAFIVVGAAAILFALIFAVGSSLSVNHLAFVERKFRMKPDDLWAVITQYSVFSEWRSGITSLTIDSLNHWTEINKYGDKVSYRMDVIDKKRTFTTTILNKDLPYGGFWEFSLVPGENDCTLKITEHGKVFNPLFRFLSKFVFGHEATLNEYLKDLEERVKDSRSTAL